MIIGTLRKDRKTKPASLKSELLKYLRHGIKNEAVQKIKKKALDMMANGPKPRRLKKIQDNSDCENESIDGDNQNMCDQVCKVRGVANSPSMLVTVMLSANCTMPVDGFDCYTVPHFKSIQRASQKATEISSQNYSAHNQWRADAETIPHSIKTST
jgi:hypothetical protein